MNISSKFNPSASSFSWRLWWALWLSSMIVTRIDLLSLNWLRSFFRKAMKATELVDVSSVKSGFLDADLWLPSPWRLCLYIWLMGTWWVRQLGSRSSCFAATDWRMPRRSTPKACPKRLLSQVRRQKFNDERRRSPRVIGCKRSQLPWI